MHLVFGSLPTLPEGGEGLRLIASPVFGGGWWGNPAKILSKDK
jgi:hypothetical protein